ncbi:transposase-like protein [Bradyrhizobium sp. USDA 4474]
MGWMETCAVDERMRFVVAAQKHEESFAAVCRRFGVSRRVGYKWLARFEAEPPPLRRAFPLHSPGVTGGASPWSTQPGRRPKTSSSAVTAPATSSENISNVLKLYRYLRKTDRMQPRQMVLSDSPARLSDLRAGPATPP